MTSFRHENVPLALGILIDNSGSMRPKRQKVNEAALNLVRSSKLHDEVFVVNFGEQYYLDQDFTDDVAKLKVALDKVETSGSTALYDSIVASAAHIRQGATIQKRVLLVVTDGNDNASQETLDETVQHLQQADGPVVYVIAFVDESKRTYPIMHALQAISLNTGGTAYFPKNLDQVNAITKSIAYDIRDQYVIDYKSSNPMTGHAYHAIQVQAIAAPETNFECGPGPGTTASRPQRPSSCSHSTAVGLLQVLRCLSKNGSLSPCQLDVALGRSAYGSQRSLGEVMQREADHAHDSETELEAMVSLLQRESSRQLAQERAEGASQTSKRVS